MNNLKSDGERVQSFYSIKFAHERTWVKFDEENIGETIEKFWEIFKKNLSWFGKSLGKSCSNFEKV